MALVLLALVLVLRAHAATPSQRTPRRAHRPGVQLGGTLRPAIDGTTPATGARMTGTMLTESVVTGHFRFAVPLPIALVLLV